MKNEKYPIVRVTWYDAQSHDEWVDIKDAIKSTSKIYSVGYLIHDGEREITIAQNYDVPNDSVSMTIAILNSWVEELEYLYVE